MKPSSPKSAGFASFGLCREIERAIAAAGFEEARPIQRGIIPAVLEGRDVMGLAQTGTGKTAAFALPILDLLVDAPGQGPQVLIVAPTRELASQIEAEIRSLARYTRIRTVTVFGGVPQGPQVRALKRRPDILVACPGRLLDLHQQRVLSLDGINMLVLDEAHHMFDMGFLPDIRRILAALPQDRQNMLFSATMPPEIRKLADRILYQPHIVELAHSAPAETIEHAFYPVPRDRKQALLLQLLSDSQRRSSIIFTRTKRGAKRLALKLNRRGFNAVALQGNMSQNQRNRAMAGFRSGTFDILVATDIAARGIDVAQVSHVINFDIPNTPDAYTHRIGRTGRAERNGKAITLVSEQDLDMVAAIERRLKTAIARCQVPGFEGVVIPRTSLQPAGRRPASRSPVRYGRSTGRRQNRRRYRPARATC